MSKPKFCTEDFQTGTSLLHQGETTLMPNVPFPGPHWSVPWHPGVSVGTPTTNLMYLNPLFPAKACTLDKVAYEITTQGAGSGTQVMRFGIYDADNSTGRPTGSPLIDLSTVDLEATVGVKVFDHTNQALNAKLYWFAAVYQTSGGVTTSAQVRHGFLPVYHMNYVTDTQTTPTIGGANPGGMMFTQASVSGALPTIGTLSMSTAAAPCVLFKFL